MKYFKTPNVG